MKEAQGSEKKHQELLYFILAINTIFTIQSLLVERVSSYEYKSGDKFTFPYMIVFLKGFVVLCTLNSFDIVVKKGVFLKLFTMAVIMFVNEQLSFLGTQKLSYRIMQVASTLKLLPIVAMKYLFFNEVVPSQMTYSCLLTTIGTFIFAVDFKRLLAMKEIHSDTVVGAGMILVILCLQGFLNSMQDSVFKKHAISSTVMILYTNIFKVVLSLVQTAYNVRPIISFIKNDSTVLLHIGAIVILGAFGQKIVYSCVKKRGTITTNYITLTRKILSIVLTSIIYRHPLNSNHLVGLGFIITGLLILVVKRNQVEAVKDR